VTIGANHLHSIPIRPEKIGLHVQEVVQFYCSGVAAIPQRGKFWVIVFKAADVFYETGGTHRRVEVRVALRAIRVACVRKSNRSAMIGVAGSASGHERARRMMRRAVMAREAFQVDDLSVIKTQGGQMAGGTLPGENRMRGRQVSGGVHSTVAANPEPGNAREG